MCTVSCCCCRGNAALALVRTEEQRMRSHICSRPAWSTRSQSFSAEADGMTCWLALCLSVSLCLCLLCVSVSSVSVSVSCSLLEWLNPGLLDRDPGVLEDTLVCP